MRRNLPVALAAALLLSGCIELLAADDGVAPLTVPPLLGGESFKMRQEWTGHHLRTTFSGGGLGTTVEVLQDREDITRLVEDEVVVLDAWRRPVQTVAFRQTMQDLDPGNNELENWSAASYFETASGRLVAEEFTAAQMVPRDGICTPTACANPYDVERVTGTLFPRESMPAEWSSLAGSTLHIGQEIIRTAEHVDSYSGFRFLATVRYSVLAEEWLNGERTFVVGATQQWRVIDPPPVMTAASPTPESDQPPLPPRVNLLWFSERASVPEQVVIVVPFRFEGSTYSMKYAANLTEFNPGTRPIPWGVGEALQPGTLPAGAVNLGLLLEEKAEVGRYPASQAWQNVNGDPSLIEFGAYRDRHPAEPPTGALFLPFEDPVETNYWTFQLGTTFMNAEGAVATSRQQVVQRPVAIVENREDDFNDIWPFMVAATPDEGATTPAMPLEAARAFYTDVGKEKEPMIQILAGHHDFHQGLSPLSATAVFARASEWRTTIGPTPINDVRIVLAGEPVTINLLDGGLASINMNLIASLVSWRLVPGAPLMDAQWTESGDLSFVPRVALPLPE
jgi:hypothetical protein